MDITEVVKQIECIGKAYEKIKPRMPQSTFSNTIKAIKSGTCKQSTMIEFLGKFGYIKTEQWEMDDKPHCDICKVPIHTGVSAKVYYCSLHGPGL